MLLLATAPFMLLDSCISSDEVVDDDYCYIWEVSLGSLKRETVVLNSSGEDTTIISTYTGSEYPMTINQRTQTIENVDSLLYGTNLRAVLIDISFTGSRLAYRAKDDTEGDWLVYNSTDSMDLRKPVELLLVANDGLSSRVYTLQLNVHKQEGDSLYWNKADAAVPQLQGMSQQRAIIVGGNLAVLGKKADAVTLVERTADGAWNEIPTNLPAETNVETVVKQNNVFFVSTTEGDIYTTTNGKDWVKKDISQHPGMVLAGATPDYLYALMDGELYRCDAREQGEWKFQPEALDESSVYLPSKDVKTLLMQQTNGSQRMVMLGNRTDDNDKTSVVWNKMWNDDTAEGEAIWMFLNQTEDNKCTLPQLEHLNLIQYDDKCMAFGGASVTGRGTNKAMDALYVSEDYGISWHKDTEWHLPAQLKGVEGPISSVVDDNNVIWIIANGEVWRGKLNRLDFEQQ